MNYDKVFAPIPKSEKRKFIFKLKIKCEKKNINLIYTFVAAVKKITRMHTSIVLIKFKRYSTEIHLKNDPPAKIQVKNRVKKYQVFHITNDEHFPDVRSKAYIFVVY